jgi:hypothetical protein
MSEADTDHMAVYLQRTAAGVAALRCRRLVRRTAAPWTRSLLPLSAATGGVLKRFRVDC